MRSMTPLASNVSTIWCTDGGETLKYFCMRRSLRFFSSCSSSSVIAGFPFEQKVFACHAAQDHPLQPVQIVKTITAGLAHGAQQRFPWILPHQTQQLSQGKRDYLAAPLFQAHDIVGQFGRGCDDSR